MIQQIWNLRLEDQMPLRCSLSGGLDLERVELLVHPDQCKLTGDIGMRLRRKLAGRIVLTDELIDSLLRQTDKIPREWIGMTLVCLGSLYRRPDIDCIRPIKSRRPDDDLWARSLVIAPRRIFDQPLSVYAKLDRTCGVPVLRE